jgi:hypothetical protein
VRTRTPWDRTPVRLESTGDCTAPFFKRGQLGKSKITACHVLFKNKNKNIAFLFNFDIVLKSVVGMQ